MTAMRTSRTLILALGLCLLASSAAVAQQQVALVDIGDNSVVWNPLTADKMVLTVSGPSGDFRFELEAGEKAAFDIFDKAGALIQDGSYTWQMTTLPSVSAETRAAMQKSRDEGTRFTGTLPQSFNQSGAFMVKAGYFVLPAQEAANKPGELVAPNKDQVILDDLIVAGSICAGLDCVNGESFGFDTIRLKENNLRIKFQDTSVSASFPTNDWQIAANDTGNGGQNKFSIDDIDGGRTPFTIEASAPTNSLYVDSGGRIGLGTNSPVVELHMPSGDTPTVRLEQDGSSGFTPQTWDMAGNETNWFVRDATNGSTLPLKILPGADTNAIVIDANGDVGLGTTSPSAPLHLIESDGTAQIFIDENSISAAAFDGMLKIDSAATTGIVSAVNIATAGARPRFTMTHGNVPNGTWNWDILNVTGNFALIQNGGSTFTFENDGDFSIAGNFFAGAGQLDVPDYVFADDYDLMPLEDVKAFIDENSHLPEVPSAATVKAEGLDMTEMQMTLLKKVEELTLHTIDQHETIRSQQDTIQQLMERLEALESAQK